MSKVFGNLCDATKVIDDRVRILAQLK